MVGAAALPLRVAVALSGGVDSAVTALMLHRCVHSAADVAALRCFGNADAPPPPLPTLLAALEARQPLHRLLPTGVGAALVSSDTSRVSLYPFYMRNWHDVDAPHGWCVRSQRDYDDAQAVAHALQLLPSSTALPLLDLAAAYATRCFQHMLYAYAAGHTLNVDVLCNSRIKFGAAADALGVLQASTTTVGETKPSSGQRTLLATGHYARTWCLPTIDSSHPALLLQPCSAGHDLNDQTHFLARVSPCRLAGALFPLGHLFTRKADVRAVAQHCFGSDSGVAHIAAKVTSTGICFVGPPRRADTTSSGAAAAAASCNTRFAHFLNDFVPPPPPQPRTTLPACTVFRDAVTGAEKTLAAEDAAWRRLRDDYPTHLPAYAFTLGQRVRLCNADGGGAAVPHYVAAKTCLPAIRSAPSGEARLLAEVRVVDRWDDPLLFTATVPAVSMVFWLPTAALRRAVAACGGADDRDEYAFRCLCAVRHQATPQPAVVRWCRSSEAALNGESSPSARRLAGLRVRSCTVCFDEPVRCPAAGQAVVLYASLAVVEDLVVSRGMPVQPPACAPTPLAVVGAAWVATAAAGDVSVDHLQSLH